MMARLAYAARFVRFYLRAKTVYRVHSPFVFELAGRVLEDKRTYYAFESIETLRARLLQDSRSITITDFGAGSQVVDGNERTVSSLAKFAANGPFAGQLLFRLVQVIGPRTVLEFGTSLGISTLYQALAAGQRARILTLEGCPATAAIARENFDWMRRPDIEQMIGPFEKTLSAALEQLDPLDYVFFDGNHRRQPTIDYFEQCLARAHDQSVFVFDDIHWSEEMEAAWAYIQAHPRVTLTVDFFFSGVVFFRPEFKVKQHHALVPVKWKPWMAGFFAGN